MNQIAALLASLASEQARLVAIQGVLRTRLLESQAAATDESVDQLLTAEEVAKALGLPGGGFSGVPVAYRSRGASRSTPFAIPNRA